MTSPGVCRLQAAGQAVRAAREARWPDDPAHDAKVARALADGWFIAKVTPRATYLSPHRDGRLPNHGLHQVPLGLADQLTLHTSDHADHHQLHTHQDLAGSCRQPIIEDAP
jgi:hypothetical protein